MQSESTYTIRVDLSTRTIPNLREYCHSVAKLVRSWLRNERPILARLENTRAQKEANRLAAFKSHLDRSWYDNENLRAGGARKALGSTSLPELSPVPQQDEGAVAE